MRRIQPGLESNVQICTPYTSAGALVSELLGCIDSIQHDALLLHVSPSVGNLLTRPQVRSLYIQPGSPWENGYIESFNGKMRDELYNGEIFCSLKRAQVLIEMWRKHYNTIRPHSSLGYRAPIPATILVQSGQIQSVRLS